MTGCALVGVTSSNLVTQKQSRIFDAILSTANFISVGTTMVGTFLISYRIYSVRKHTGNSVQRFRHILEIVIESSAMYSLSLLVEAIAEILYIDAALATPIFAAVSYSSALGFVISVRVSTLV